MIHGTHLPLEHEITAPLRAVLEKCLEKEPANRYTSMRDMVGDLRRVLGQSVGTAPQHPVRRIRLAAAAVLMALGLAAGSALIIWRLQRRPAPARLEYTQLTNFADSATCPALSPDGRMLLSSEASTPSWVRDRFTSSCCPTVSRLSSRMTT